MIQFGLRLHDAEKLPVEQVLPLVRQKGFTCAHVALSKSFKELPCTPSALTPGYALYLRHLFEKNGIDIAVLGNYLNLAHPDADALHAIQEKYYAHIRFASLLGCGMVGTDTLIEVSDMKKLEWALLLGMVGAVCCSALTGTAQSYRSLEQNVLRLHILANSDSIDDQALKLKVRDKVLEQADTLFAGDAESVEDAETIAAENLETLEQTAQQLVWDEGYSYPVKAQLVEMPFDDRTYGDWVMPAGEYTALRITIGAAQGQNWWCVMYPSLCVPNACDVTADEETAEDAFGKPEQDLLRHHERYAIKLKCVEWLEKWF